jgi:hypothetical protein
LVSSELDSNNTVLVDILSTILSCPKGTCLIAAGLILMNTAKFQFKTAIFFPNPHSSTASPHYVHLSFLMSTVTSEMRNLSQIHRTQLRYLQYY